MLLPLKIELRGLEVFLFRGLGVVLVTDDVRASMKPFDSAPFFSCMNIYILFENY